MLAIIKAEKEKIGREIQAQKKAEERLAKKSGVANPNKIQNVNGVIFKKPPRPDGIMH